MNYLEILGTVLGLVYLYLEYHVNLWLWIVGIIMPAVYLVVYYDAGLYADFGISIYYILASVYGLVCWLMQHRNSSASDGNNTAATTRPEDNITRMPAGRWGAVSIAAATIFILLGYILVRYTDSTVPWADAATTALSVVAMWLLARKYLEQWLIWIAADVGCAALYLYKGLYFTSALYLLYAIIAVFGYRKWRALMKTGH